MIENREIVLYHYPFSPYARRIIWYLNLRGINYTECIQPAYLPRPDLDSLSISYRRIPVLALGRDIYLDTRIMLSALEAAFPYSNAASSSGSAGRPQTTALLHPVPATAEAHALTALLSKHATATALFPHASRLIPLSTPLLQNPAFRADRSSFQGRPWTPAAIRAQRPEALVHVRDAFALLEHGLLSDARDWGLRTPGPTLADLEAAWVLHWVWGMEGALEGGAGGGIDASEFPLVWAYLRRWDAVTKGARGNASVQRVRGEEARRRVLGGELGGEGGRSEPGRGKGGVGTGVDGRDALGLREGAEVEVWPTDSGFERRDRGRLVGLTRDEGVIEKVVDGRSIRLHFPRIGFRIEEVGEGGEGTEGKEAKL